MSTEADRKLAMALLHTVENQVDDTLGNSIAKPFVSGGYDAQLDMFCKEMVGECERAEKKAPDDPEVVFKSAVLQAQLYGNWQKMQGSRGTQKSAVECYERALQLVKDAELEAQIRYRYGLFCTATAAGTGGGKDKAIQNFERVVQLVGIDNPVGMEAAQELEKTKSQKGGCFIATAAYGSTFAPEVQAFYQFRDQNLLTSGFGRILVKLYYFVSPPLAALISKSDWLRLFTRGLFLTPILRLLKLTSINDSKEEK